MLNRRNLLKGVALAALAPLTTGFPGSARAGSSGGNQESGRGFFRFKVGELEVTALADGGGFVKPDILHGLPPIELDRLLRRAGLDPAVGSPTPINAFLVKAPGRTLLVDTGAGTYFGPRAGRLTEHLRAAGCEPETIDTVLLTHLHSDHAMGLTDVAGKPRFPGATVWVAGPEAAYWHDPKTLASAQERKKRYIKALDRALLPYAAGGRLRRFDPDQAPIAGVTVVPLFGHTPGHCGFRLGVGGRTVLFWGDTVHVAAVQFARPEVSIDFDVDQTRAVATRRALLSGLARDGELVAGAHLPFPGLGWVRPRGAGHYAWEPAPCGAAGA